MRQYTRNSVAVAFTLVILASAVVAGLSASALAQTTEPTETNETEAGAQATGESWPTYRADAGRSGATTADGPEPYGELRWGDTFSGEPVGAPTDVDGTAYLAVETEREYYKKAGAVVAYDSETGTAEWQRTGLGDPHGSPTVAHDTVYVATEAADTELDWAEGSDGDGGLYALDAETGETEWVRNETEYWTESVAHANGTLYTLRQPVTPDAGNTSIVAVDEETGETEWSVDARYFFGIADGTLYGAHEGDMFAVDPSTGERLWSADAPPGGKYGTHGIVSVTDQAIVAVHDDADGVLRASAYSPADGSTLWNTTVTNNSYGYYRPAVTDDAVFITSYRGELVRLDTATGAETWRYEPKEGKLSGGPTLANDTVYVGSHTLKETEEDEEGYRGLRHAVIAIDAENGSQQWGYVTDSGDYGDRDRVLAPSVVDDSLYISSHTNNMYPQDSTGNVYAFGASATEPSEDDTPSDGFHESKEAGLDAHISVTEDDPDESFGTAKNVTLEAGATSVRSGNVTTYEWDVDDDGEFETTGEEMFVTVERCLSRTVTLRVTSDDGTTDTESVVLRNR